MAGSCCEELWMEWVVVCMAQAEPDWTLFTRLAPGVPSVPPPGSRVTAGARTFTSVLLFLPSVKLAVQRAVFSEAITLIAGLEGEVIYMSSLVTDWLIDWLHNYILSHRLSPHLMHTHSRTSALTQPCESWDALLSPALPPFQEPSAPSSAPHAVFRSHSESHAESVWVWCHRLQRSLCPLYECGSDRGKSGFSWVSEDVGRQTTWIRLRKCVSCFRTLIVPPDSFFCVILYLVLAWRAWGGLNYWALCL